MIDLPEVNIFKHSSHSCIKLIGFSKNKKRPTTEDYGGESPFKTQEPANSLEEKYHMRTYRARKAVYVD